MTTKEERRKALAEWLREVSALLVVFPVIDQLVRPEAFNWMLVITSYVLVLLLLGSGMYLTRGEK